MKTCPKCKETKQITEFSKSVRERDGLQPSCKACDKANHNRRARQRANGGKLSSGIAEKLFKLQKNDKHPAEFMQQPGFLI